ncbi:MAG: hypothetical protein F4213_18825 [Boseongicola sp. SB0677_bin_26]|nr:hypothetical protein [Boseongicola sp. SB0665_bin_10]MYG28045.1 hypothetical protein [Boseongicola sp. SB0677_bin_26]
MSDRARSPSGRNGTGKSTTLLRRLRRLREEPGRHIAICTLEDPIEYVIQGDGIVQFAVNPGTSPGGGEDQ